MQPTHCYSLSDNLGNGFVLDKDERCLYWNLNSTGDINNQDNEEEDKEEDDEEDDEEVKDNNHNNTQRHQLETTGKQSLQTQ